ncbi:hypothetical protein DK843_04730 [Chromobacterium phragmitis]|uniref:Flagellar hook-length control protein-like C-terminal domain-containing protein n=2 Tax=Chromobacterium phragmitis TaxID=2202141 RepID=A0A344UEI7_9NEIS|nr:hypothetical protein DK843_04730 [Chromobacterium phragmitis]
MGTSMSRVAPPQTAALASAPPGEGEAAINPAMDDLSWMDVDPTAGFADAMSDAGARQALPEEPLAAVAPSLADASRQAVPALAADGEPPAEKGDADDKPRKAVDAAALSPALQPQTWQALMPRQPLAPRSPEADNAPAADVGRIADAAPAARLADKPLPAPLADLATPRVLELHPGADVLPAARPADAGKPADSFSLALPAAQPESWSGKLQAALGERLPALSSQNMDRATLRLDPPSLGTLEISLRHHAGALTVELTASHGEVVRQLQGIGEALRQDLGGRQYTQVAVEVREGLPSGHGQGGRQGREQQERQQPGRALSEQGWAQADAFQLDQG